MHRNNKRSCSNEITYMTFRFSDFSISKQILPNLLSNIDQLIKFKKVVVNINMKTLIYKSTRLYQVTWYQRQDTGPE